MTPMKFLASVFLFCALAVHAKEEPLLSIGVARIDITPNEPIRLHGYGNRRSNSVGVAQHLFAKALAFGSDKEGASILFTVDNLAVSGAITDEVAAWLKKRAGIKREQVGLCSSHTHSAPVLSNVAPNIFSMDIIPAEQAAIDRYTRELVEKLEQVAVVALSNRAPSKLSWAEGTVNFAKNRRVVRDGRTQFGDNDTAPVDHALATMFVHGADGKLRAVLVNYACHCTTLGGERNLVNGDWSGCAQEAIERDNAGAIALVSIGCGGDANPFPRGTPELAQAHGDEIATEVRRLLNLEGQALRVPDRDGTRGTRPSRPITKLPEGKLKRFALDFDPLPTRAQWEERATKPGIVGYHAKKNLARLDRGEKLPTKLPYVVGTWTFGDELAMVFLAGEVVVDYEKRLKREFDSARLWVNGYANDVPCYIPSRRILDEGGYEAEDSLWYYDRPARLAMSSEDRIVKAVHDLLPNKFAARANRADGGGAGAANAGTRNANVSAPLSPKQALDSMRVGAEFTVDLVAVEPLVIDPVAIDWGADGKLWVVEMRDYPMGVDGKWKPGGVVKFLEDRDGDGHYEKATVFLDNLPFPTGVFAWRKGVLICAAPDIIYAEDTDGDGRADVVRKIFTGFATNNFQARVNSLSLGLDGWVYGANGLLGGKIRFGGRTSSASSTPNGDSQSLSLQGELDIRGRDFRMNPDTGAFEPASGLTQQGRVRDDFANWFGCDNSHLLWHYPLADEYVRRNPFVAPPGPAVHLPQGRDWNRIFPASETLERFNDPQSANRVTSACGLEIYRDELLGKEFYGNAFTCEPVHNLVHREVLTPDGVTFRSARATNELSREFLASTDNWFRPVQARTGPDGALWVVDMYRYVIEHPRWIPSNRLAQLDVRAGDDKGRIYRVYRKGSPPRDIRDFTKLSTSDLAAALDSPNGAERDIVHRELLNRGDKAANEQLRDVAKNSSRAAVRVQASALLASLGGVTAPWLADRFRVEKDPNVREQLLRVAERSGDSSNEIEEASRDSHLRVRYQAALALHEPASAARALKELLPEAVTNAWLRAAVLSSSTNCASDLLAGASEHNALVTPLLATLTGLGDRRGLEKALDAVIPEGESKVSATRLNAIATLLETDPTLGSHGTLARVLPFARHVLVDEQAPTPLRAGAFRVVAANLGLHDDDVNLVAQFLKPNSLQANAVQSLTRRPSGKGADALIGGWQSFSPSQRLTIIESLATRAEGLDRLLGAVEGNRISAAEIPLTLRARLLAHDRTTVRERAARLWPERPSDRAQVLAAYRKSVASNGDTAQGAAVFDRMCSSCHALNGRGHAVGPDLAPLRDKSADDFLLAILDPNAAIEPRFLSYNVETKDGRSLSGVIRSESASGFTLVQGGGIEHRLLRNEVAETKASALSLMPEGLEQGITPEQMNDLISFLKKPAPRIFGSATPEQIQSARRAFREQRPNGFSRILFAPEQLDYPSWLGRLPLAHCRQTDGKSRVTWQTAAPKAGGDTCSFTLAAAMGFISQPAGTFTLKLNAKRVLDFNVALDDTIWASADGAVRMSYQVMEANSEDSNGILTVTVSREFVKENEPLVFEVAGSAANSQRWFGIYDFNATTTTASR